MSLRAQSNPEILAYMQRKQPLAPSLIEAEDVARTAVFLLSDAARMTTGEVVSVDAGWHVSG
jgi:enoyl-[acyl-carrier-protein] reductase (NADH)